MNPFTAGILSQPARYLKLILFILIPFFSVSVKSQSDYIFNKLTNKDGLSNNTINDIAQDSSGLLWIATKQGLNKYDSYGFTKYDKEEYPEIPSNVITALAINTYNTLFIGTTKGLVSYDSEYNRFTPLVFERENLPSISSLCVSESNLVMIGTVLGWYLYLPDGDQMIRQNSLQNEAITSIVQLSSTSFYISTNSGIYVIDDDGTLQNHYQKDGNSNLPTNMINILYPDKDGDVWVGTLDEGLFLLDVDKGNFRSVILSKESLTGSEFIRDITEDHLGNLWVGTEAGVFICNKGNTSVTYIGHSLEESEYFLNDNAIYDLFLSNENIMWVGTYFGGINYTILENQKKFNHIYPGNDENELKGKAVNKMMQDTKGMLWFTTEDGGACRYDPASRSILEYLEFDPLKGLSSNNIHSVCEDKYGNIWFGHFRTGIDIYDPDLHSFRHVLPNPDETDKFRYNSVYSLFVDSRGVLWVGTRSNIKTYDYKDQSFRSFMPDQIAGVFIYDIAEDSEGRIWFSTRQQGVICFDPEKDTLVHYRMGSTNQKGLSSDQIISSMAEKDGKMWFGTMDGGVNIYHPEQDTFLVISTLNGLPSNTVYGMLKDESEYVWISSNAGLSRYNPANGACKNYTLKDGLSQMQFNFGSYFKDNAGTLYFGSIGGLTYFDPSAIHDNPAPPKVILTDFKLFNKSVGIGDNGLLYRQIDDAESIRLRYAQNVFTIDYVAINYYSPGNNHFFYYLDGFEQGWNDAGNRTSATYTNLSPGTYNFYVKARNNDGLESTEIKTVGIRVLRPWWLSSAAIILYVGLFILILIISRRAIIMREKDKTALRIEKIEKRRMMQLNQQRINFFTYISHEFKTPLSIIIASIQELMEKTDWSEEAARKFDAVKRSAKRLSFLIGQLMDFRRIETKHARLELQKGNVISFLKDTCLAFSSMYSRQEIDFTFSASIEAHTCWFDPDKLEKIVTNLISNAIKYTPSQGKIECNVVIQGLLQDNNEQKLLLIRISDSGEGMDERELELAFEPFHMDPAKQRVQSGTGIGLTLVKSLVEYLGGTIQVKSDPESGTDFTVSLPVNLNRSSNISLEERAIDGNPGIDIEHVSYTSGTSFKWEQDEPDQGSCHILVVEDTADLAELLISHFSKNYRVSYAQNGLDALELVKQEEPDLIISDIMMPGLNGLDLCKQIKDNEETSHIAVILLTAKASHEDKIEGLRAGAEAYVSKPFDFNELDLHVSHFIDTRKKLKKSLLIENSLNLDHLVMHDKDKMFIENVTKLINENIANESFTIEEMASHLGMSKTLVYLKFKKLISMSAKEYLQLLRFKKAIELMLSSDYNISEVAYEVGFSDPNYFSRAFKKMYNLTPSEYKMQLAEKLNKNNRE